MIDGLKNYDLWQQSLGIPPTLPSFYWNVYSYEQRIKEICLRLQRMLDYQDVSTDKINELVDTINAIDIDSITASITKLTSDLAALNVSLSNEIAAREAGDQKAQTNLQQEITDRVAAIKTVTDSVTALDARVTQNTQQISDEVTARTNLGNSLTEAITNETTAREAKDKELDQQIADLTADQPSIESENIYTGSDKVPTVTAIQNSLSQAVTADNKIATMADISGGGGGTNITSITPLTVSNIPSVGIDAFAWGDGAKANGEGSVAIGSNTRASGRNSVAIGRGAHVDEDGVISVGNGGLTGLTRRITNVGLPTNETDAVTKGYVDNHNAKSFLNNSLTTSGLDGYDRNVNITPYEVYRISWTLKNNSDSVVVNTGYTTLSYVAGSGETITCAQYPRYLDSGATASYSAIFSVHDASSIRIYAGDTSNLITVTGYTLSEIKTDTKA